MSLFGPRKVSIQDVLTNSLGGMIAGFIGSLIILIIIFLASGLINLNIASEFQDARVGLGTNGMFPFLLSFITFIATTIKMFATYFILNITDPERYKKNLISMGQIAFFGILTYIFLAPLYIFIGIQSYDYIMIIFIGHTILLSFGISIILELLNNYRYILTSIYGSFVGLFLTIIITVTIFYSLPQGYARLISLLVLLPIINTSTIFFKGLFELAYFYYNKYTNLDQLGDIFYQIEQEAKEEVREGIEKNSI